MLAGGDPLFYGISRYLTDCVRQRSIRGGPARQQHAVGIRAGQGEVGTTPIFQISPTQSLDRVVDSIRTAERVGLFTTEAISPAVVAEALLDRRIDYFTAYVCENLGTP